MKITFIKDYIVKQGDGKGPIYMVGDTKDFVGISAETYARKYIRLGVAKEYEAPAPVVQPKAEPEPDPIAEQSQPAPAELRTEETLPEDEDQPSGNRKPLRNRR